MGTITPKVVALLWRGPFFRLETALSLTGDDAFGNYWLYAFNINFYFGGYFYVAILTFIHRTRGQTGG
jgi:hypothetical protein